MGNLHPAVEGAIIGVIIAIVLYGLEYYLLKKQAKERGFTFPMAWRFGRGPCAC